MTPKQVQLDTASYFYITEQNVMGGQLVQRIYCSAHRTSINNVFCVVALKILFFSIYIFLFVSHYNLNLLMKTYLIGIMAEDTYLRRKRLAE